MELLLLGLAGLGGLALLLQSKPLPSKEDAEKAFAILEKNPLDPDANTTFGKYKAFVMGDYDGAMPYLVHSKDTTLKTLAEHELDATYTATPPQKVGMGDEWVAAAKKFQALNRIFYTRASQWYALAWPDLDAVWKAKSRAQGLKLAAARPPGAGRKGFPSGWMTDTHPKGWPQPASDGLFSREGSYSVKLSASDAKTANSYTSVASDLIPISGKLAEISAFVLTDRTDSGLDHIEIRFYDKTGKEVNRQATGLVPVDLPFWIKIGAKIQVPADAVRIQFAIVITSKTGSVWVDDVSIKIDGKEVVKNGGFETP